MSDTSLRLAALERRLRRLYFLSVTAIALLLLFVGAAAMQKAKQDLSATNLTADSISTGSFTLRDDQGRPRVAIRMGEDGAPFVSLLDQNTKVRLLLTLLEKEFPLVQLSNANEEPQMNLFYNPNLGSAVTMSGSGGNALYALPTGKTPMIQFSDSDGASVFQAP
jgi:hypothetical protein